MRNRSSAILCGLLLLASLGTAEARAPSRDVYEPAMTSSGNYLAAVVARNARDVNAEAQFLREALLADPTDPEYLRRSLFAFLSNGNLNDAFVVAERLMRSKPEPEIALLARTALVVGAMHERRFRTATRILEDDAAKTTGGDPSLALLKAWSKIGSGRPKEAFAIVKPLEGGRTAALIDYFKGLMAVVVRDKALARTHLKRAHESEPKELRVADAYGRFLASQGEIKAALAIYEAIDKTVPGQVLIAEPLATLRAGKIPGPLVSSAQEGAAELFFLLSDAGDPSPAARLRENIYLQFASYLAPEKAVYAAGLAQSFENSGQTQRAIDVYETVPSRSNLRASSDVRRVNALLRLERPDEAQKLLDGLLKARPKDLDLLRTAALLHRSEKRWDQAISFYSRALEVASPIKVENWDLLYGRAVSHERAKNWPMAEADFKAVLELLPKAKPGEPYARERAQALNYLAYTWVDRHENIDQAFIMLKDAIALTEGREGYIVDSIGWAHYRLGQYDEAVKELERAVELMPGDPVINDHLGDAYWKVGRKLEAEFKWNHARSLDPEPEDLKRILDKIANGLKEPPKASANTKAGNGG